ncbi:dynein heavy chain domain-containing protein 1 isoform X2 [Sarcophilus harrisii]|uniref:dynein heavy chain domain-containing protein 1 isoform X2 n=1 Tax=Sarcophilus harrisii TaxID=9305 RepID=UPI001301AB2A|nr:dynein heavy chain domain-containing protein 1 isoform X2 [Sarcophilus harrisii]
MSYPMTSSPKEHGLPSSPPSSPVLLNQEIRPVKPVTWDWQSKPELWAQVLRQQLNAQLQLSQKPDQSPAVELLLAELQVLLTAVLKDGSPAAWYYLYNVLASLSPYQTLLCGHLHIVPLLEQLYAWAPHIQAQLGLDFLEMLKQTFPPDTSMMVPSSHTSCRNQKLRVPYSQAGLGPPCPFVQAEQGQTQKSTNEDKNWVYPVTLSQLQYALGIVGVDVAHDEAFWMNGLGLLPLALATNIPVKYLSRKEEEYPESGAGYTHQLLIATEERSTEMVSSDFSSKANLLKNKIISFLQESKYRSQIHFIYLNLVTTGGFRPYCLTVVPKRLANPEHYIFSPFGILHVHPEEGNEFITLGVWHRHAMLWQRLQNISFFKHYFVRKAFTCWRKNVKRQVLQKRKDFLRNYLFFAIPHFGICLLHINRFLQELNSVSWLPQEENRCYTLTELQRTLAKMNREALKVLRRYLRLSAAVLQLVHEDTYRMRQGLQERVESVSEYSSAKGSMYRKWFRRQQLMQKLNRAELWWQLLGRLACLVDLMTCQNLISILENELIKFVTCVLQAPRTVALLTGKLAFDEDGKLLVVPSAEQMAHSLSEGLKTVVTSALTVMKTADPQTPVNLPQASDEAQTGGSTTNTSTMLVEEEDEEELDSALISLALRAQSNEAVRIFCGPETEMVRSRKPDSSARPLEVLGHRIRSQYAPPSRIQLQIDLDTNDGIQKALATQKTLVEDMLLEVKKFCQNYKWLRNIHQFLKNWGPQKLESIENWSATRYQRLLTDLESWQNRVSEVPTELFTENLLLRLNCNCVQTDIGSLLKNVKDDILAQVNSVRDTECEELMNELSEFVEVFQNIFDDIQTITKCFQKLTEANEKSEDLEERVDHVCALNNIIRSHFGKLSYEDEGLEIALLDVWETFLFERQQASEVLLGRQSTLVPQLQEMMSDALKEMEDLSIQALNDPFMDPTQDQHSTEQELIKMEHRYFSISAHLAELHHAYVILSGERSPVPEPQRGPRPILLQQRVWHLFRVISEQISEWKCLAFSKFSTSLAWDKTDEWLTEAAKLSRLFMVANPVIQTCMRLVEEFRSYLPVLSMMDYSHLQISSWHSIFRAMGAGCPENIELLTLGQLLSYPLLEYRNRISQIWINENERHQIQDSMRELEQTWKGQQLRLLNFILYVPYEPPPSENSRRHSHSRGQGQQLEIVAKDSGTYMLSDISSLQDGIQESLQTLRKILNSQYTENIRDQAQEWVAIFRGLRALMEVWVVFQQKWIFLNKVIYEMKINLPSPELSRRFQVVDSQYRELMQISLEDPLVLSLMVPSGSRNPRFQDQQLQRLLHVGNFELEHITIALETVLYGVRSRFPRLFFLSDGELVALMSAPREAAETQLWVHRCFPHIQTVVFQPCSISSGPTALEVKEEAQSIVGKFGEVLALRSPLPLQHDIPKWLSSLEQWIRAALVYGLSDCVAARLALNQSLDHVFQQPQGPGEPHLYLHSHHWLDLAQAFPVQCVLVAEEVAWRTHVEEAMQNKKVHLLSFMQLRKMEALSNFAREQRNTHIGHPPPSPRLSFLLTLLLTRVIAHRDTAVLLQQQQVTESEDFHWARQLKYYLGPQNSSQIPDSNESPKVGSSRRKKPTCWVEVLGHPFLYSYEYVGPGQRRIASLLLERPALGLLLALKEAACGTLLGPIGVGKSALMGRLASALGRQLVILHCVMHMEAHCLESYLNGALQSGAWLLLKAAGALPIGLLSALGQRLDDLRRLYLPLLLGAPEISELDPLKPQILGNSFFENHRVHVRFGYGCFLTLTHLSSTLPTNLRFLIRPVTMALPNLRQLTEVTLMGAGLRDAVRLASRLATFFTLEQALEPRLLPSRLPILVQILETTLQFLETPKEQQGLQLPRTLGAAEEAALLHALLHSPLFNGPERPHLLMLRQLLRDIFSGAGNVLATPWAVTPPKLTKELRKIGLSVGPDFLCSLEQLSQALRQVRGILLMGPPGSGKSTCWQALAKVWNQLVARNKASRDVRPVKTTSLYPSSLNPEEFLGWFEEHYWNHGVFSQLLWAGMNQHMREPQGIQHWIVCDGVPSAAWLDPVASLLSNAANISLPNGQQIPWPRDTWFLLEIVNTAGMSPYIIGSCALVYCGGHQTWQAMLATLMTELPREYYLLPQTMVELQDLADDLVPPMLHFLNRQGANSVLHVHGQPASSPGVAEIYSMTHLLQGLLNPYLHYTEEEQYHITSGDNMSHSSSMVQDSEGTQESISAEGLQKDMDGDKKRRNHLLAINSFLLAFIWGFGSHLPSRHWSTFDNFVRGILKHHSEYPELPTCTSVFDLHLCSEDGSLVPFSGLYLSKRIKGTIGTFNFSAQAECVLYVTDLLLSAGHPVLLTGETGSGKSAFVEVLVEPNHPCVHIPIHLALTTTHLRNLLNQEIQKQNQNWPGKIVPPRGSFLFYLKDLHMAAADPTRKCQPVLETLRQVLSHSTLYDNDTLELQAVPTTFNWLATATAPCCSELPLCSRLTRLFTVLLLDNVSRVTILSRHCAGVQAWLERFPSLEKKELMARALVTATLDAWEEMRTHFPASPHRPHYRFSAHTIEHLLNSLQLLYPRPPVRLAHTSSRLEQLRRMSGLRGAPLVTLVTVRTVAHLWLHEAQRIFADRLITDTERERCVQMLLAVATSAFCSNTDYKSIWESEEVEEEGKELVPEVESEEELAQWEDHSSSESEDEDEPGTRDLLALTVNWSPLGSGPKFLNLPLTGPAPLDQAPPSVISVTLSHKNISSTKLEKKSKIRWQKAYHLSVSVPLLLPALLLLPQERASELLFTQELSLESTMEESRLYLQQTWEVLEQQLETALPELGPGPRLSSCRPFAQHVARLARVLAGPQQHGILLSYTRGTGRRTALYLAARLSQACLFELPLEPKEAVLKCLKQAVWHAGFVGKPAALMVPERASSSLLNLLLGLAQEGYFPGLYSEEELKTIAEQLPLENIAVKIRPKKEMVLLRFRRLVCNNLHVFILMSESSRPPQIRPTTFLALLDRACISIDYYEPWNKTTLISLAQHYMESIFNKRLELECPRLPALKASVANIAKVMALIHLSATKYYQLLCPLLPLATPKTFLDFLDTFLLLFFHLSNRIQNKIQRIQTALGKLTMVIEQNTAHYRLVENLENELRSAHEDLLNCQKQLEADRMQYLQFLKNCEQQEVVLSNLTKQRDVLQSQEESLAEKMDETFLGPLIQLKVADVEELRSYRAPPASVVAVTDALCVLFHCPPGWENAKQLLGKEGFFEGQ